MLSYRRSMFARVAIMVGPGLIPVLLMLSSHRLNTREAARTAFGGIVYSTCISSMCWVILPRIAARVLRLPRGRRWTLLVSSIMAAAAAGCLLASAFLFAAGFTRVDDVVPDFVSSLNISLVLTLIFGLGSFFYEVVVHRLNAAAQDAERLRQMATEARLSSLESRIHPHFLFNTLNSISALIREDPAKAERMVERLASLLRFSLDANERRLVPLSLELKIVRDYLEIEQTRFGARLRYQIDAPGEMLDIEIPPLSVQILVENSVKHAVSTRREGAAIEIRARMIAGIPAIDVIDDGPGFDLTALKSGHGLDLLQSRLAALFGPSAALELASERGRMRATVVLA